MDLDALAASIICTGWRIWITRDADHEWIHVGAAELPTDNRNAGQLGEFGDRFVVPPSWTDTDVISRVFCTLQFLADHELREQFTVNGVRVFEPHEPSVTGEQHDWFVEHRSALAGYG